LLRKGKAPSTGNSSNRKRIRFFSCRLNPGELIEDKIDEELEHRRYPGNVGEGHGVEVTRLQIQTSGRLLNRPIYCLSIFSFCIFNKISD
jgi:hypothetical protein